MKRNIELLTQVRDLIKAEPAKLDMGLWGTVSADLVTFDNGSKAKVSCGTTACVAGWTVQLAGDKLLVEQDQYDNAYPKLGTDDEYEKVFTVSHSVAKNGRVVDIEERATKLLGLTPEEGGILFFEDTELVVERLGELIAGKDIAADYYGYDDDDD